MKITLREAALITFIVCQHLAWWIDSNAEYTQLWRTAQAEQRRLAAEVEQTP